MCAAPAAAAALAVLFPIIFNHPFPFFPLTIVLVIDIVTLARIASVCIEDVVVRINKRMCYGRSRPEIIGLFTSTVCKLAVC